MAIIVSGTPGTGKSSLAKELAKAISYTYLDVKKLIAEKRLGEDFDKSRRCEIVDTEHLNKELIKLIKADKRLVIDSHLSHFLPRKYVESCIITTCELKALERRLKKRGYSKEKIRENLDAEIFEVCKTEAGELGHTIIVVDTTRKADIPKLIKRLKIPKMRKGVGES